MWAQNLDVLGGYRGVSLTWVGADQVERRGGFQLSARPMPAKFQFRNIPKQLAAAPVKNYRRIIAARWIGRQDWFQPKYKTR